MIHSKPNKLLKKSKLAAQANSINMILLVLVLSLVAVVSIVIINNIRNDNVKSLVRAYSMEVSQVFHSYINQDLVLVHKVSYSKALTNWFFNERDEDKKAIAFDEIMDYADILENACLYIGINASFNEYIIVNKAELEGFLPHARLDLLSAEDAWYFRCINSNNEYSLNIDIDKYTNTMHLWINHKVILDKQPVGVFCSGLEIPDIFKKVFGNNKNMKVKGYIIDKYGYIQSESTENYSFDINNPKHIRGENPDSAFSSLLNSYLSRINGFFVDHSEPEIIKISGGSYRYLAINPIEDTDWSVVIFYNPDSFSGITPFLPLMIVMLAALFLYVAGTNTLMKRFLFAPLANLTHDVSEGKYTDVDLYGRDRNDEIGELARTIRDTTHEQLRQKNLLHAVNSAAGLLLAAADEENIKTLLLGGMEIIGLYLDVDRINIWRLETIDGVICYVNQIQWLNQISRWEKPAPGIHAYNEIPNWEEKFLRNEYVSGPFSIMPHPEMEIMISLGVKSVLAVPLYIKGQFYGLLSFDDCHKERTFFEDEVNILRSAGLMIVSAMNRNAQTVQLRKAHEYNMLMLDATPLGCCIWDKNFNAIDCNNEAVMLFDLGSKQEYLDRFFDLSPQYQSGGSLSTDLIMQNLRKALDDGKFVFEWNYQKLDGTPIPAEITLVRVPYEDDNIVAGYIRDLREHKQMMNDIEQRDNLLHIGQSAAVVLLSATNEEMFEVSLREGMELIGNSIDVDRVYIYQNEKRDGELFYVKKYEWVNSFGSAAPIIPTNEALPYNGNLEWENNFSQGICINGPLYSLSQDDQDFFRKFGIKSVLMIPVYLQEEFWGFIGFDDCREERFFSEDEVDILRSVGYMIVSAINRNLQTVQLRQAHEHTQVLLDAMPLSCQLWNTDGKCFDCNEEALKLFKVKRKKEFIDRFLELSPEYQLDGELSSKKAFEYLDRAFKDGKCVFEWIHRDTEGTMIPSEVTLVPVHFGNEDVVAAYARDLRESKKMIQAIEQRDNLLYTVNRAATILLQPETEKFESYLQYCMGMMADTVGIDRVTIWKNSKIDDKLFCSQLYEWQGGPVPQENNLSSKNVPYSKIIPSWESILSNGDCIIGLVRDMPEAEQAELTSRGILSIFVMPVFWKDEFWGFVGYDNCHQERLFSESEQSILYSHGLLLANALLRNDMTRNIRATALKLEAVVANYSGIIWSVDNNFMITLYNGLLLEQMGKESSLIEGKNLDTYMNQEQHSEMKIKIRNTFTEGPQDWISEIDNKILHARSTPILDENGVTTSVVGSFDDITELSRLQADLEAALNEARDANNAKTNFLANMSHEMRTPLNAIIGLSELTLGTGTLDEECFSNCERVYNAGMTLLSTVNDILDISKIEAGKFQIFPVEYDLPSLLNDTITQSILYMGEKPIEFKLDINENLPSRLCGDDLRVKQILNNLLSNAFKYTRMGKVELSINCSIDNDSVWLSIRIQDTGIGIRKEELKNLYSAYSQLDSNYTRKIEGTGLGLSITKRIVEMMEGTITAESEYGKGSVFSVKLRQKLVNNEVIGKEIVNSLVTFRYADQKRVRNSKLTRIRLPYAHVLVVDDVVNNLDVVKGMLKPYGMQVDCVTNGPEAIDAIRSEKNKYNAIFMDHMMPGMDGVEAVRIIREEIGTEYARTVPIIALTANAILGSEKMFLEKGFQAFISKPIEIGRLDTVIHEWVRNKDYEKSMEQVNINGQDLPNIRSGHDRRVFNDRRSGIDRRSFGRVINGIDLDKGILRFSGDEESYLRVLHSYAANTPPLLEQMQRVTKDNLADYAVTVHGIKGSSRGICAEQIGTKAEALEKAAKEGNFNFVTANNASLISTIRKLIEDIEAMLAEITPENSKPKKEKPDMAVLSKLLAACEAYDMDGVDSAMEEIESCEYTLDDGLVVWLKENVEKMNFTQIKERLEKIK